MWPAPDSNQPLSQITCGYAPDVSLVLSQFEFLIKLLQAEIWLTRRVHLVRLQARLSERVVIELLAQMQRLGRLPEALMHTSNGREYITKQQVLAEVETALQVAGGRLAVLELPALIGVDLVHCEEQVATLAQVRNSCSGFSS